MKNFLIVIALLVGASHVQAAETLDDTKVNKAILAFISFEVLNHGNVSSEEWDRFAGDAVKAAQLVDGQSTCVQEQLGTKFASSNISALIFKASGAALQIAIQPANFGKLVESLENAKKLEDPSKRFDEVFGSVYMIVWMSRDIVSQWQKVEEAVNEAGKLMLAVCPGSSATQQNP